jgi:PII-like signaling protein
MIKSQGHGRRLRIYIGANDQWRGGPLYAAIVQEARKHGMAGATVARGIMGYGVHRAIHEAHVLQVSNNLPVVVEIVDTHEKVQSFLPHLETMIREGLITVSDVEVITYGKKK